MTTAARLLSAFLLFSLSALPGTSAHAQPPAPTPAIPSDGSDGDFVVSANQTIDLSNAVLGTWNTPVAVGNKGRGIYDASKWAVVFKYNSVNIAAGATVTFKNHASRAPVVWLVKGDVTINGSLNVSGEGGRTDGRLSEPGPGGFRGGSQVLSESQPAGGGFGPGGGNYRGDGSYAQQGGYESPGATYGNVQILPLIGGSGGSGHRNGWSGGAGGGAILIVATGTVTLNGSITARGGNRGNDTPGGSGGAIRLIANAVAGNGSLDARAGNSASGEGRIRIEANSGADSLVITPNTTRVSPTPLKIWPDADAPTIRVVSVDGITQNLADPKSNLDASGADILINKTTQVRILLETTNAPVPPTNPASTVTVRITRKHGNPIILDAIFDSGTAMKATWKVDTILPEGFSAIQAKVVVP